MTIRGNEGRGIIVGLALATIYVFLFGPLPQLLGVYTQADAQILSAVGEWAGGLASVLTLLVVAAAALLTLKEISELRKDRDAQLILAIFERYDEHPEIIEIRGLIYEYEQQLRCATCSLRVEEDRDRKKLDKVIDSIGHRSLTFNSINYLLMRLDHVCFLLRKGFVSAELKIDFYHGIVRLWRILGSIVVYERDRRDLRGESQWWVRNFIALAEEMESSKFRRELEKRSKKEPDVPRPFRKV